MSSRPLRVLVVEDEMTIALMIEDMLIELGHEVPAMAMRLPHGIECAQTAEIDFAVLDVNLDGRMSLPIADVLEARSIPFIFVTGYGAAGLEAKYREHHIVLQKPFAQVDIAHAIRELNIGAQ